MCDSGINIEHGGGDRPNLSGNESLEGRSFPEREGAIEIYKIHNKAIFNWTALILFIIMPPEGA